MTLPHISDYYLPKSFVNHNVSLRQVVVKLIMPCASNFVYLDNTWRRIMCELYKRIEELMEEKGITAYRLCKDIKISAGIMTDLKCGRKNTLSASTLDKVSRYFGVSSSYLLGTEQKKRPPPLPVMASPKRIRLCLIGSVLYRQKSRKQSLFLKTRQKIFSDLRIVYHL